MHGVGGEEEACQQAPGSSTQNGATESGEEGRDGPVEPYVDQVVAPGAQAMQGVVEPEGEGAERAEGLMAAAVGEQGAPEVVVQDVGPRGLREKVLIGLDGPAGEKEKTGISYSTMNHD